MDANPLHTYTKLKESAMTQQYVVAGGVATITDPGFYDHWFDDAGYLEAVCAGPTPEIVAKKRLVFEFEAALARMMLNHSAEQDADGILEEYLTDEYIQHDPNIPHNGRAALALGFKLMPPSDDVPPPPVSLIVEGELVTLLMCKPMPDPTTPGELYDWFIPTIFRVRDGRLAEHWGAFQKGSAPVGPEVK